MSDEKKWMSRAELDRNLRKVAASEHFIDAHEFSSKIYREHAALLDECERLKKECNEWNESQAECVSYLEIENERLLESVKARSKTITKLQEDKDRIKKQLNKWEFQEREALVDLGKQVEQLQSRLAEYEPEQLDDMETAEKKLSEKINKLVSEQKDFEVQFEDNKLFVAAVDWPNSQSEPESYTFPYAPKREPEVGDLVLYADGDRGGAVIPVIIEKIEEGLISNVVGYCLGVDECTQTPYRLFDGEIVRRRG